MIKLFIVLIISIISLTLLGKLVLRLFKFNQLNGFAGWFSSSLVGLLVIVLGFSIAKTAGETVHLFFVPIFILLIIEFKKSDYLTKVKLSKRHVFSALSVLFAMFYINYQTIPEDLLFTPSLDLFVYVDHVKTLSEFGKENNLGFVSNTLNNNIQVTPYHYFELWIAAFYTSIFNIEAIKSYSILTNSILYFISFLGIMTLVESYQKVSIIKIMYCGLLIFFGGLFVDVYSYLPYMDSAKYLISSLVLDNSAIYPFLIASLILFDRGFKTTSIIMLLILPIISFSTFPAVVGGIMLYTLLNKEFYLTEKIKIVTSTLMMFVSLVCFYYFLGNSSGSRMSFEDLLPVFLFLHPEIDAFDFIITKVGVLFGLYPLKICLVYFVPFLILLKWKQDFLIFKPVLFILVVGLISSFIFVINPEATWLFRNAGLASINVIFIYVLIKNYKFNFSIKPRKILISICIICLASVGIDLMMGTVHLSGNEHSKQYLKQIHNQFVGSENVVGGLFLTSSYFENAFVKNPKTVLPTTYLNGMNQYAGVVSLNTHSIIPSKKIGFGEIEKRIIDNSEFEIFRDQETNIEELTAEFIKNNDLKFLVFEKSFNVPHYLESHIAKTIIDSESGEKFCVLAQL